MTQKTWTYQVGYEFTGGPTLPAGALPDDRPRWTGNGSTGAEITRNAPLTEDGWAVLGEWLAQAGGYATCTVTSAVEMPVGNV